MISVSIIAKDKSIILPGRLDSARQVSNDVVIITNADHQFVNFADQKKFAASKCKHKWILSLDSDEEISPALISELKTLDFEQFVAFKIPRLNIIFCKEIRHTNWEPSADTHIWLFDKTKCHWEGKVHEEIVANGSVGILHGHKIHYSYQTVEEFMDKMNDYTSRETKIVNPFFDFFRRYIWHMGFLDGWHGLFLSYLMAVYHTVTWAKKNSSLS